MGLISAIIQCTVLHLGGSLQLGATAKVCECQITPKPPPTGEREKKRGVGGEQRMERADMEGGGFQKSVKVFPSANIECWRLYRREARGHTHHTHQLLH